MTDFELEHEQRLDRQLDAALSATPSVAIPADFAARVLNALPPRRMPAAVALPRIPASPSIGYRIALAALAVLAVILFAVGIAFGTTHEIAKIAVESLFAGEFALLMAWVALRPRALR